MASANPNWDGSPVTLTQNDTAAMASTPNASIVLGWQNLATQGQDGTLAVTSAAEAPAMLDAPAFANGPSFRVNNFQGNNVMVANVSVQAPTPIFVEMYGPGIPGIVPVPLQMNVPLQLSPGAVAQGPAQPTNVRLRLQATGANTSAIVVIGGPVDARGNNGYVFGLNMPSSPPNYTKTTQGNSLDYGPFNWGSSTIFVANMSSSNAGPVSVLLQVL